MQGFWVILENVGVLSSIALIGYIASRSGYLPDAENVRLSISKLIVKLVLPLLIITSLLKNNLNAQMAQNAIIIAVITIIFIPFSFLTTWFIGRLIKLPDSTLIVFSSLIAFGNVIFFGYPLITALYGEEGLFYAAVFALINDLYVYSAGIFLMSKYGTKNAGKASYKQIINPLTVSFGIALLLMWLKSLFPHVFASYAAGVILRPLTMIGACTIPLAMFFIGMTLANVNIKEVFYPASKWVVTLLRCIILPIGMLFLLRLFNIAAIVLAVAVMQMAMPTQTMVTVLSHEYGADSKYSAEATFITLICSVVTLPFIHWIITNTIG